MLRYGLIIWILTYASLSQVKSQSDFWTMDGTIIKHDYYHFSDSLSEPIIYELQGEDGLPVWFGRKVYKDVCETGECKMINIWLFWDGTGNYSGFQIEDKEPLTKTDHDIFQENDYQRLHQLLADTNSVLKFLSQEDLTIGPFEDGTVDAYTSATQPSLAQVVVKDAVYTCYTLWHLVYGEIRQHILSILDARINSEYLQKMLLSKKPEHSIWAIHSIMRNPVYHKYFNLQIINLIRLENASVVNAAIQYTESLLQLDSIEQVELLHTMVDVNLNTKHRVLRLFLQLQSVDDVIITSILDQVLNESLYIYEYNSIIRLIKPHHLFQGNP